MVRRRLLYLAVLLGCLVFYTAYREWFSWFALMGVLCLPLFSLAVSLPAMLAVKVTPDIPARVQIGIPAELTCRTVSRLPAPPVGGSFRLHNRMTGAVYTLKAGQLLPTEHCGLLAIEPVRAWISDYMGLIRLPVRRAEGCDIFVEPVAIPTAEPPQMKRQAVHLWRPKPGGGFAENHDLRLYRPGDSLRLIHWKMAAKTGKLIYREPIVPAQDGFLLTMSLSGKAETLDEKLGKFLWLSRYLIGKQIPHTLQCYTGRGVQTWSITDAAGIEAALRILLQQPAAREALLPETGTAAHRYHIGGGTDEA